MPATTTDASVYERALAFERAQQVRAGATSTPHPLGRVARHAGHPGYWSLNELQVFASAPAGLDARALVDAADAAQADLPHRRVVVDDDALGAALAPALVERGWDATRDVYMALRRPLPEGRSARARERDLETLLTVKLPLTEDAVGRPEREFIAGGTRAMATPGTRFVVAEHDGAPAAYATVYSDGATAQVEDVATLPHARRNGLARDVVGHAVALALEAGHDLVFMVADADDWPRRLYAELGFDPVGHGWSMVRSPR